MLLTEIKHEAVVLPIESTSEIASLAGDAESVLGYMALREAIDEPTELPRLLKALGELGIEILNQQDVITYMRERLCDKTLELLDEWQKASPDPLRSWTSFSGPSWVITDISKYKEPVPEFVLNKAIQIKRAMPDVQIVIRHLSEDKDPFLEVHLGKFDTWGDGNGERYWVEVWEEPKFEGRLR